MKNKIGAVALALIAATAACPLLALDASFEVTPLLTIPYDTAPAGQQYQAYKLGGGCSLSADLAFFGLLAPYVEAGYRLAPLNDSSATKNLSLVNGGAGLSLVVNPIPRISTRLGAAGGVYAAMLGDANSMSLYYSGRAELGYRFTPTFSILASADYASFLTEAAPVYSGFSAGISVKLGLGTRGKGTGVLVEDSQAEDLFPIRYYAYEKNRIGSVTLTNREQGEIRDVKVSLLAGQYGAREAPCGSVPLLRKGASVELPLYAAFNESVLAFTEGTKVQAEILVRYKLLDTAMEAKKGVALRFNHRNALTWADERAAAAFVSPNDPAMLDLSKYLAGLVRERIRPEIDKNLQYGMGVFEGLRLAGVIWAADPSTPYREFAKTGDKLDYLQYPYQTLAYKSGDSDDVSVLMAEALESVGISSALVPLDDEMLVAFPLSGKEATIRSSLSSAVDLVFVGEQAWLPLESSKIREGFLSAWQGGSKKWKEAEAAGRKPGIMVVSEAWKAYPPVGLPAVDFRPPKPMEEQVGLAFENVLGRFIAKEIDPKVKAYQAELSNGDSPKVRNTLGVLYARYGLLAEAKDQFVKAVAKGYSPAFTNLANVAFLLKDYETAARWFEEALKVTPNSKAALIGLARARYELDAYAEADDLFGRVKAIDSALAERYAYLSSKVDASANRASSAAADRAGAMSWSEED